MTDFFSKLKHISSRIKASESDQSALKMSSSQSGLNGQSQSSMPSSQSSKWKANHPHANAPEEWKPLYRRWWAWAVMVAGATAGGGAIAGLVYIQDLKQELPDTAEVLIYVRDGTLTIRSADGATLQQLGPATREKLSYEEMPEQVIQAFVSSEDRNFYRHGGIDYRAIARAVKANVVAGEVVEGASTITQQLARIVFLDQERSVSRKLKEALLAQRIEENLTKQQILERYLNLVYLGSGAYGIADAAWIYFSKSVDDLSLGEIAMIAGLPPAPSDYSPLVDEAAALQRRNVVLNRMVESGYITEAEKNAAIAEPITVKSSPPRNLYSQVPYFTSYIQEELKKYVTTEQLAAGGLTVETTLNLQWQQHAQETINSAIERYGPGQRFSQAALAAIDPRNGEIKALVGGNDFTDSQFNRAVQAQRQPGSTFKALVYTTAIAAGFSPYKSYVDAKLVVDGYEPQNYSRSFRGAVSMRDALISSINVVAVKVLIDVGFEPVVEMAQKMGIKSDLLPAYSLALGSSEVNLLELTSAYGTLANKGLHVEPHGIRRITDRYGNVLYEVKNEPERAIDEDTAAIMDWMLRGVVTSGTGTNARLPDRAVAGKTGTSEKRRDLWFVGYIPQLVVGVWMGNDDSSPTWGASSTAARTWRNFMSNLLEDIPPEDFPELPRLSGREGTIKAQPVKPRKMVADSAPSRRERSRSSDDEPSRSSSGSSSRSREEAPPAPEETETPRRRSSSEPTPESRQREPEASDPPPVEDAPIPSAPPSADPPPIVDEAPAPPPAPEPPPLPFPSPDLPPSSRPEPPAPPPIPLPSQSRSEPQSSDS